MAVEYFKGKKSGMHFFRVKGANGEIVAQSEAYGREHDAERGYMALLQAVQRDSVYLLLDTMLRGWSIHEASYDKERNEYKKDQIECMVEAAEGNGMLGYLLHLFSHWSNDVQHVANHYGLAYECIGEHKGAPITVRRLIPPAPREDAYWENGQWIEPPLTEADPDVEAK